MLFYSVIVRWSAILKRVNNLYYGFFVCFFRSIVKCMPDDCVRMKPYILYDIYSTV